MSTANAKPALLLSLALVLAGLILGAVTGFGGGSLLGGLLAAGGVIPAAYATWAGMQKETQTSLGLGLLMLFVSLGVAGLLLILWLVSLIR